MLEPRTASLGTDSSVRAVVGSSATCCLIDAPGCPFVSALLLCRLLLLQMGVYSEQILKAWPSCTRYYLVDLWGHQVRSLCFRIRAARLHAQKYHWEGTSRSHYSPSGGVDACLHLSLLPGRPLGVGRILSCFLCWEGCSGLGDVWRRCQGRTAPVSILSLHPLMMQACRRITTMAPTWPTRSRSGGSRRPAGASHPGAARCWLGGLP